MHVSSTAAEFVIPTFAVYASTKAFNKIFAQSLDLSLRRSSVFGHFVESLIVQPGGTSTSMIGNQKGFGMVMPNVLARTCLDDFGSGATLSNGALETVFSMKFFMEGIMVPFHPAIKYLLPKVGMEAEMTRIRK